MLFQLTSAGRALLNANPTGTPVTRAEFGSGFNYVPISNPTGLQGSVVYTSNVVFEPSIQDSNTLRYSVFIPGPVGPFTFGEVALYSGSTLFGVGAQVTSISKTVGAVDNQYRLDVFVDLLNGQHFASFEVVSSATRNFFPRVPSVDALVAPHFDTNNAYVVYGSQQAGEGFLAYSDPSGIWSFSNKPHVWFQGDVTSVGDQGLLCEDLLGAEYTGNYGDLVLQFISGKLRGYCRKLTDVTSNGQFMWNTLLLEYADVEAGDQFIVSGPPASIGFSGVHNDLTGIQGGLTDERYHLSAADYANVQFPRLKTKAVSTSTYTVLATDDDTYITIAQDCVVSMDNPSTSTYPIGGVTTFRVNNAQVTFQSINGSTLNPSNSVAIDCTGLEVTFAVVRKAAQVWDLVAPANDLGSGAGNVVHSFANAARANRFTIPMYSDTGSETGPDAEIEMSRLSANDQSLRIIPGLLTQTSSWSAPAVLTWPIAPGSTGSSPTGLPNTSVLRPLQFSINGTGYTLNIMGSAAQTFATLVSTLNAAALVALPSGTSLIFSMFHDQLVLRAGSAAGTTTLVLANTSVLNEVTTYVNPTRTAVSETVAIGDDALVLDNFDANVSFVRPVSATSKAVGFRSRVKGLFSSVFGGRMTVVEGDFSTAVGSSGGYVLALRSLLFGGTHNLIAKILGGSGTVRDSAIIGGTGNTITDDGTSTTELSLVSMSNGVKVTGDHSVAIGADASNLKKSSIAIASSGADLTGDNMMVLGSRTILGSGAARNVAVIGGATLGVTARNTVVMFQHDLNIVQDAALYFPTGSNVTDKGQVATPFTVHTSAYGANAALKLTTDSQTQTSLNVMQVLNGHGWMFQGTVSANRGSADFKGWNVSGHLFNILGTVSIQGLNFEVVGETNGAINWELDLVVDPTNTDRVYFTLNTTGPVSGLDVVAASAFITVNSARPLL